MFSSRCALALLLVGSISTTSVAITHADEPVAPPSAATEEAKRYFEQGESLRAAGQFQAALEAYLKSRALVPRATNTLNVAVCLHALKRYDEAYEYFEEALTKYPNAQLQPAPRESANKAMADIEVKVGRLDVSANIDGTLVIDGRSRGKLPLLAPTRVMPGKHVVRVLRDGFATFEQTVQVAEKETVRVDAKLEALTSAGRLRVEGPAELEGGDVTIDGAVVGALPWEGTLAPGTHIYQVVKGELGTGPELAVVIVGQTVKRTVVASPLGAERRVVVDPPTASLSIDGVVTGKGRFQGRLPLGKHVIEAREEGYVAARVPVDVTATESSDVPVKLTVDATHPRWGVAAKSRIAIGALLGYGVAPSFGNDSMWCRDTTECSGSAAMGVRFGISGTYELPSGLDVFVEGGYSSLTRTMSRRFARAVAGIVSDATYDLKDEVRLSSIWLATGLGYRFKLGERIDLGTRLMVVAARATARDSVTATVSGGGTTRDGYASGSGASADGVMIEIDPELAVGLWFGTHIRATFGLAVPISILRGPKLDLKDTHARPGASCAAVPLGCVAGQPLPPQNENVSDVFVRFVPQVSVGYWF